MNQILDLQTISVDDRPEDTSILTIGASDISLLLCGG